MLVVLVVDVGGVVGANVVVDGGYPYGGGGKDGSLLS